MVRETEGQGFRCRVRQAYSWRTMETNFENGTGTRMVASVCGRLPKQTNQKANGGGVDGDLDPLTLFLCLRRARAHPQKDRKC